MELRSSVTVLAISTFAVGACGAPAKQVGDSKTGTLNRNSEQETSPAASGNQDEEDAALARDGYSVLCEGVLRGCVRAVREPTFALLKSRHPVDRTCNDKELKLGERVADMYYTEYGAFTRSGLREELVVLAFHDCPQTRMADKYRIVLVRDGAAIIDMESRWNQVLCHPDLDNDGDEELVLGQFTMDDSGATRQSVSVVDIKDGALEVIHDFGQTSQSDCTGKSGTESRHAKLYVKNVDGQLTFDTRWRSESCEAKRGRHKARRRL